MSMHGRVINVDDTEAGDVFAADTAAGVTVIGLTDVSDFDEDGGWALIGGVPTAYSSVDPDAETMSLVEPLADDAVEGDWVAAWDAESGSAVVERTAMVVLDEQVEGDPLECSVDHQLVPFLLPGARGETGESVVIDDDGDELRIVDVLGKTPSMDLSVAIPGTIPPALPSDPPAGSPSLTAYGHPRGIIVQADAVETGVTIDYHLSTETGFVPDETTLVRSTASTVIDIQTLPDGVTPLDPDTVYYLAAVARNAAGSAPVGVEIEAGMRLVDDDAIDTISASKLAAGELLAAYALLGSLAIGNITIDPDNGIDVPGAMTIPADGVSPVTLVARAVLESLTLKGDASMLGLTQLFGLLRVANGITNPLTPPSVTQGWPSLRTELADDDIVAPSRAHGLVERVGNSAQWVTVRDYVGGGNWYSVVKATGERDPFIFGSMPAGFFPYGGVTVVGSTYYVLGQDNNRSGQWWVYAFNSTFTKTGEWFFAGNASIPKQPAIGVDSDTGRILIAWSAANGRMFVREYSTAGTLYRQNLVLAAGFPVYAIGGVHGGTADYDARTFTILTKSGPVYCATAGTWVDDTTPLDQPGYVFFDRAGGSQVAGLWWDGTRYRHLDTSGRIWDYSRNVRWVNVKVGHTWYDGDAGGTGTHETEQSPTRDVQWGARKWLYVSTPPPPDQGNTDAGQADKANRVRTYVGVNPADPNDHLYLAGQWRQHTLAVDEVDAPAIDILDTSTAHPPTSNGFISAGASPGRIESTGTDANGDPWWQLRGDGYARMRGLTRPGRTVITVGSDTTEHTETVTFNPPFPAGSTVRVIGQQVTGGGFFYAGGARAASATGFTAWAQKSGPSGSTTITIDWIAMAE